MRGAELLSIRLHQVDNGPNLGQAPQYLVNPTFSGISVGNCNEEGPNGGVTECVYTADPSTTTAPSSGSAHPGLRAHAAAAALLAGASVVVLL